MSSIMVSSTTELYNKGLHNYQELILRVPYGTPLSPMLSSKLAQVESCANQLLAKANDDLMALYHASVLFELMHGYTTYDARRIQKELTRVLLLAEAVRNRSISRSLTGLYAIFDHDINSKSDLDIDDLYRFFDMTEVTILTFAYYDDYAPGVYYDYQQLCDDICKKSLAVFMEYINPEVDKLLLADSGQKEELTTRYQNVVRLSIYLNRLMPSEEVYNTLQEFIVSIQEFLENELGYKLPASLIPNDLSLDWFKEQELFLECKALKDFSSYFELYPTGYFYILAFSESYFLHKIDDVLFWKSCFKKGKVMEYYEKYPQGVMADTALFYLSSLN